MTTERAPGEGKRGPRKGAGGRPRKKTPLDPDTPNAATVEILTDETPAAGATGGADPGMVPPPPLDITVGDIKTLWGFALAGSGFVAQQICEPVQVRAYWQTSDENLQRLAEATVRVLEKYAVEFRFGPELALIMAGAGVFAPAVMATYAAVTEAGPLALQPYRKHLTGAEWSGILKLWRTQPAMRQTILDQLKARFNNDNHVSGGNNGRGENQPGKAPDPVIENPPVDRVRSAV